MTRPTAPPTWLINFIIVVVAGAWVANFVCRATIATYTPPEGLDALMLAVVGFLLAGRQASRELPPDDDDRPDREGDDE